VRERGANKSTVYPKYKPLKSTQKSFCAVSYNLAGEGHFSEILVAQGCPFCASSYIISGVNFINVLQARFSYKIFGAKISNPKDSFVVFGAKILYEKCDALKES